MIPVATFALVRPVPFLPLVYSALANHLLCLGAIDTTQARSIVLDGVLDVAADGALARSGNISNGRVRESCSVGSAFTLKSTADPDAAGCYTTERADSPGTIFGQEWSAVTDVEDIAGIGVMQAISIPASSSGTSPWPSTVSSSFAALDVYDKAQVRANAVPCIRSTVSACTQGSSALCVLETHTNWWRTAL